MGKSKKHKLKNIAKEPTGLLSVKETELTSASEFVPAGHANVEKVIEELQSVNVTIRECGCTTLASLVDQPTAIPLLLQQNVVKIVAPLIMDENPHIRHISLGALRNLSVSGGHTVCEEMVQKDILTPLTALFHQYGTDWKPTEESEKTHKHDDCLEDIFTEAVHLLWNLCESTDTAVKVFNKECIIQYLIPCLSPAVYGFKTAISVAQCLHAATENNKMATEYCQSMEVTSVLEKLISPEDKSESILLSSLVAGIVVNTSDLLSPQIPVVSIIQALGKIVSVDVNTLILGCQNGETGAGDFATTSNSVDHPLEDKELDGQLKHVNNILNAQQIALQTLANMCCSDDDEWEDGSCSSDELTDDLPMEESSEDFAPVSLPSEVHSALKSNEILAKVLRKAEPVEEDKQVVLNNNENGFKIVASLLKVQIHALLCVNNLLSAMCEEDLGGLDQLHTMWDTLLKLSTSPQVKETLELLDAVTCAMRAVVQKLAELQSSKFATITIADLQYLFSLCHVSDNSQIRINAVRCVGTIGSLLNQCEPQHKLLKDIGYCLLEVIGRDSDLRSVAESLDCVFDVFGEDNVDSVVRELDLVEKLRNFLPILKSKMKSQKREYGEHYAVITTARTNLVRFIKYKQSTLKM